jgi:hypothetical protein
MENIFEPTDKFNFEKLILTKPISIPGGNYFIKCLINENPLYLQPPRCKTKQGIIKAGKRIYSDLMFSNENDQFIRWMENLETHCQKYIYKNRAHWFEGDLELHDIENYFTSPLKVYKSGKYYTLRTNITPVLGKPSLKIYDENEKEVELESINDNMDIITILEIQGIKCSQRSFQIEIEIKQMLVMKPKNLFEKCLIKPRNVDTAEAMDTTDTHIEEDISEETKTITEPIIENIDTNRIDLTIVKPDEEQEVLAEKNDEPVIVNTILNETVKEEIQAETKEETKFDDPNEIQEVEFNLEELNASDSIQIKKRNDVYYEMYREARRKAKIARDLALSSYLEAKRIKNTYMLDDIKDSDDSDLETEESEEPEEKTMNENV